jgi:hypothetical protein
MKHQPNPKVVIHTSNMAYGTRIEEVEQTTSSRKQVMKAFGYSVCALAVVACLLVATGSQASTVEALEEQPAEFSVLNAPPHPAGKAVAHASHSSAHSSAAHSSAAHSSAAHSSAAHSSAAHPSAAHPVAHAPAAAHPVAHADAHPVAHADAHPAAGIGRASVLCCHHAFRACPCCWICL